MENETLEYIKHTTMFLLQSALDADGYITLPTENGTYLILERSPDSKPLLLFLVVGSEHTTLGRVTTGAGYQYFSKMYKTASLPCVDKMAKDVIEFIEGKGAIKNDIAVDTFKEALEQEGFGVALKDNKSLFVVNKGQTVKIFKVSFEGHVSVVRCLGPTPNGYTTGYSHRFPAVYPSELVKYVAGAFES